MKAITVAFMYAAFILYLLFGSPYAHAFKGYGGGGFLQGYSTGICGANPMCHTGKSMRDTPQGNSQE